MTDETAKPRALLPIGREIANARNAIASEGPLAAYRTLISENDALIGRPELDNGRRIANERTAIHTELVRHWAIEQIRKLGYEKPFAVVALGGTGRCEMTPCSDTDFAFLFDEAIEGNAFLLELQRQVLHSSDFEDQYGFQCEAMPFNLEDVVDLDGKQLNSFIDMLPVYDPTGLAGEFTERIQSSYDPFEHFLHVREFWKNQWEKAADSNERLDRFDIKNDGLRVFLAGIWTKAGKEFRHSLEIYDTLEDPRDLEAYEFLLRIRAYIHNRKQGARRPSAGGNHPEDILSFEDFLCFGDMLGEEASERERAEFANHTRSRLLSARRRISIFAKGIIESELKNGRETKPGSPIVYRSGGLNHAIASTFHDNRDKSKAALSLLVASQRYGVQIDLSELQTTFLNAGDWLERTPDLAELFYESAGSLANSFEFLSQIDGAEERLFRGYAQFEASLDQRVMTERISLRSRLERQKMRALEEMHEQGTRELDRAVSERSISELASSASQHIEAGYLDTDHLVAIKLALKTKRLPLAESDQAIRDDESSPLHKRYATGFSGTPLDEFYEPYIRECGFSEEVIEIVKFLISNRRAFKVQTESGINDALQVKEFASKCQSVDRLRALYVFTSADKSGWESESSDPTTWFNIKELYAKTLQYFRPMAQSTDSLAAAGYSPEQFAILDDFGVDFFEGRYRKYANQFGSHLVRLAENPDLNKAKVAILRDGSSQILGIAARDYRGLAATISGALWKEKVNLRQAHLFSAVNYRLALDFFHLSTDDGPIAAVLPKLIEERIEQQLHLDSEDEEDTPKPVGNISIHEWSAGLYCLRFAAAEDTSGQVYGLARKVYQRLGGNIFGLFAPSSNRKSYVSIFHSLPDDISLEDARRILSDA